MMSFIAVNASFFNFTVEDGQAGVATLLALDDKLFLDEYREHVGECRPVDTPSILKLFWSSGQEASAAGQGK